MKTIVQPSQKITVDISAIPLYHRNVITVENVFQFNIWIWRMFLIFFLLRLCSTQISCV